MGGGGQFNITATEHRFCALGNTFQTCVLQCVLKQEHENDQVIIWNSIRRKSVRVYKLSLRIGSWFGVLRGDLDARGKLVEHEQSVAFDACD